MIYASILAAGSFVAQNGNNLPRPFTLLGKRPILIHALEQFVVSPEIDRIIVVVTNEWVIYTEQLVRKWLNTEKEIHVISGGDNKNQSIRDAVLFIDKQWGVSEEDIILNHDAIRPFITQRIIDDNISAGKIYGAANTVMPTVDTVLQSSNKKIIDEIPPKSWMYSEQTPQTFRVNLLKKLYECVGMEDIKEENDVARLALKYGYEVHFVLGEYSNIKIITAFDLEVANAFLRGKTDD